MNASVKESSIIEETNNELTSGEKNFSNAYLRICTFNLLRLICLPLKREEGKSSSVKFFAYH